MALTALFDLDEDTDLLDNALLLHASAGVADLAPSTRRSDALLMLKVFRFLYVSQPLRVEVPCWLRPSNDLCL